MSTVNKFRGAFAFLSNFWKEEFWVDAYDLYFLVTGKNPGFSESRSFSTVEHLFQALKQPPGDVFDYYGAEMSPGEVKKAGRRGLLREDWIEFRLDAMRFCIEAKFATSRYGLGKGLIETGDAILVEGNTWGDNFWGSSPSVLKTGQLFSPQSENWLGRILMERRATLQNIPKTRLEPVKACPVWPIVGCGSKGHGLLAELEFFAPAEGQDPLHVDADLLYAEAKADAERIIGEIPKSVQTISFRKFR